MLYCELFKQFVRKMIVGLLSYKVPQLVEGFLPHWLGIVDTVIKFMMVKT